jgi:iron complex transport system ATP-binding protein
MKTDKLKIDGLTVGYTGRAVISNLTLEAFEPGTLTALVGPNAAGKSTLLRGLAGLQKATGSIKLGETDLLRLSLTDYSKHVGYMPQSLPQRVALTVYEAMLSALRTSGGSMSSAEARRIAMETLERLGIGSLAMRGLDELSGGQRQLASLAQAIARKPAVLLLDEPTSALDLAHQHRVMSTVQELGRERGTITIVVLHDIALASRWCERVLILSPRGLAADAAPEIAITPETLAAVYGIEARVERCSRGFVQVLVDGIVCSKDA